MPTSKRADDCICEKQDGGHVGEISVVSRRRLFAVGMDTGSHLQRPV
jgi:hypothetical protein